MGLAAISGGSNDVVDVAVVGIVDDNGGGHCTGSLVAPDLVITAQHCVAAVTGIGMCDQGGFGPPRAATNLYVTTRPTITASSADYHRAAEIVIPPGTGFCGRDIALLRLASAIGASEAMPIAPRVDMAPAAAEAYAAVGFGGTDDNGTGADTRRRRDALAVACVGAGCASTYIGDAEWRGEAGVCGGDSGGPALDASGRVIGVASRGAVGCIDPVYTTIASHRDWLVSEAIRIANLGGYAPPAWTGAAPPVDAGVDALPTDAPSGGDAGNGDDGSGGGGCCRASSGRGDASFLAVAVLVLAALAARGASRSPGRGSRRRTRHSRSRPT